MSEKPSYFAHPTALVAPGASIGRGTRVWAFCNILDGATVGEDCQICDRVFIEDGAVLGDRVTVKCGVSVWNGIHLDDDVFVGPGVLFTNDPSPRSGQHLSEYPVTRVERFASLGAGAIVLPGLTLGAFCMIGAGSVVTHDVPAFTLVRGHPGRAVGFVCACGSDLDVSLPAIRCSRCGLAYALRQGFLDAVDGPPRLPRERQG